MGYLKSFALALASAGAVGSAKPSADAPGIPGLTGLFNTTQMQSSTPPASRWTTEAPARQETPSPVNPSPQKPPLIQPRTPAPDEPAAKPQPLVETNSTNSNQTPAPVSQKNTSTDYEGAFIATGVLSFFYCIVSLSLKEGCNIHPMSILTKNTSAFIRAISNILGASESPLHSPRGESPLHTPRGESPLPPPQESPPSPLPPPEESPPSPLPPPQGLPPSAQPPIISSAPPPPRFVSATLGFNPLNSEQQASQQQASQQQASAQLGFAPPNPSPATLTQNYAISPVVEQNGRSF